jgi:cytoskeleton protein RodZ
VNVAVAVDPSKPAEAAPVAQLATSVVVPATASGVAVGGTPPLMVLKASRDTWVEATDNTGRLRIQRVVKSGEEVSFADAVTLSVVIGNAAGAQVEVRGQPMDLASVAKSNIARFEVK